MATTPSDLQSLRRRLDAIDDRMHDLLVERAEIVATVAATKRGDNTGFYQPGREAEIIRRLAARQRGALPFASVARIWRELLSASVGLETPFAVAVCGGAVAPALWDLARDHYGTQTPISVCGSTREVIDAVARRRVSAGVLPMPRAGDPDPWWPDLLSEEGQTPRVVARLPFAGRGNARTGSDALVIGCGSADATGAERKLFAIDAARPLDAERILSALASAGLVCTLFACCARGGRPLALVEIEGCRLGADAGAGALRSALGAAVYRLTALGGYAVPLPASAPEFGGKVRRPVEMDAAR